MKQITFKEQVTIEQLEQRAKDGECVSLVGSEGCVIWNQLRVWMHVYGTEGAKVSKVGTDLNQALNSMSTYTDTKTQLPVATGDVIHFSKLQYGDAIEWHKIDGSRERDIVDTKTDEGIETLEGRAFYDDATQGTLYKLDLPPLEQPKKGVLRYKTLGELERDHHRDSAGNYWEKETGVGKCLHNLSVGHFAGTPVIWIPPSADRLWMTTTDPLI